MITFLLFFVLAPARLLGLRLKGDATSPPSWIGNEDDNITVHTPELDEEELAMADEPGECMLDRNNDASIATYLTAAYNDCAQKLEAPALKGEAQQRFARPELVYSPYMTSLPVFYISRGGKREACFKAFLENFSPTLTRLDAVMLGNDLRAQLGGILEDDSIQSIIDYANTRDGRRLGTDKLQKRWGVLVAHLQAIHRAYESNQAAAIILEDDAVPLYPVWNSTLEEFLLTLPPLWQVVQLQWTIGMSESVGLKRGPKRYAPGSGWGTGAYVIHRRGMERLLEKLYNEESGKFRLDSLMDCRAITADDCLLGFTRDKGNTLKPELLGHRYRATPPMFLHDSTNSPMHKKNCCEDLVLSAEVASDTRLLNAKAVDGVLLFFAVGSSKSSAALDVLKANNQRANGSDIFLAYADQVEHNAEDPSVVKLKLLRRHWQNFGPIWSKKYSYIWAVDEDVEFQFSPHDMVEEAKRTGAAAVAPVFGSSSALRPLNDGTSPCRHRFTNYIDMRGPMMSPAAWGQIFAEAEQNSSFAGQEQKWCDSLQRSGLWRNRGHHSMACAILDSLMVSHITDHKLQLPSS